MDNGAVRHITTVSVVMVAVIAAVVSYSHMSDLAISVGEQWRSYLIPFSIDGLVVAASMTLYTRHRAGLKSGGHLARGALAGGVIASLGANMSDARPEVTAVLLAAWAPVAFAIGFELLLMQRRAERQDAKQSEVTTGTPVSRSSAAQSPISPPQAPAVPAPQPKQPAIAPAPSAVVPSRPLTLSPASRQPVTAQRQETSGNVRKRQETSQPGRPGRTNRAEESRRRDAAVALLKGLGAQLSDAEVGRRSGVSPKTVAKYRRELEQGPESGERKPA